MSNNEKNIGNEVGRVLWFDQKKGYGFIQLVTPSSTKVNEEIFFHFSSINSINTFKKVYPGEYVSFSIVEADGKSKCDNITGLYGNKLLIDNDEYIIKIINKKKRVNEGNAQEELDEEVDEEVDPEDVN